MPIVKTTAGWRFDTKGAPEEMRVRRIGRNELAAIQVALAYTDAQKEYRQNDWNGDGVLEYAQRGLSKPGKHDGLYWDTSEGELPSPAGPLFYTAGIKDGYYGYRFKIELGFRQAVHVIGSYGYHFWMSTMKPLRRGDGKPRRSR